MSEWYLVEDVEESVSQRSVSESLEAECFQNGEGLVELVFGDHTILGAVSEGLLNDLQHLLVFSLLVGFVRVVFSRRVGFLVGVYVRHCLPTIWLSFPPILNDCEFKI